MSTYIALLRAVNVGGVTLPMSDLRALLEGLGYGSVRTYLQSGNAVFEAGEDAGPPPALATAIEVRISRDIGPRVGVLVVPGGAMAGVVAANPFLSGLGGGAAAADEPGLAGGAAGPPPDEGILHATFLFGSSDGEADFGEASQAAYSDVFKAAFNKLELPADEGEEAAFVGIPPLAAPVVYLKLPHGYGRTKLTNAWFERRLGTAATTRNWRTVQALAELAGTT
ncbi:MAG TPA: DUF1697 domain-containing protein [Thermoleophilia bacterium]|nr:DUF1697 domain-containing protein [Thermoleophilia bacterium]